MKLKYLIMGLSALVSVSCSDDDGTSPMALDTTSIKAITGPGKVTFTWNIPDEADYYYVRIKYTNPDSGERIMKSASIYSNSLVFDNLLARYGEIEYEICTVLKDGTVSQPYYTNVQCDPAEVIPTKTGEKEVELKDNGIWGTKAEATDGPYPASNLIDDSFATFFHTSWTGSYWEYVDSDGTVARVDATWNQVGPPIYIVVDTFRTDIEHFRFSYTCRDDGNIANPTAMDVYVSDSFDCTDIDETNPAYNARLIKSYVDGDLPTSIAATFNSETLKADNEPFRYIWFKVNSINKNLSFLAMSNLDIIEEFWTVYDPEAVE